MPNTDALERLEQLERMERRIEALEARLQQSEDFAAIQNLKSRYGALADDRYDRRGPKPPEALEPIAAEIASLFTPQGVWDGGKALGLCRGRDEIRARMLKPTLHFSWHYFVKPKIEIDGDVARGTWDILAPVTTTEGQAMWMAGVEHDEYERMDGEWLHSAMKLRVIFMAPHEKGWAQR